MVNDVGELESYYIHEQEWESYEQLQESFEWVFPEQFNTATYVCDRWKDAKGRVALFTKSPDGDDATYTFWELWKLSNQLANHFDALGIGEGDTVAVHGSQRIESLVGLIATWKIGGIVVPTSTLAGEESLRYRLNDCEARAVVADESVDETVRAACRDVPSIEEVVFMDDEGDADDERNFWQAIEGRERTFETREKAPDDVACILYTSGTTGKPKGARLPHQVLLGHVPYFASVICNLEIHDSDLIWTPVEWTWVASIYVRLLPALFFGVPMVAYDRDGFDPTAAFELIHDLGVTIIGCPATALRMMQEVDETGKYDLETIRVIGSGGESLGEDIRSWAAETFDGAVVHEGYGQTEANAIIGECSALFKHRDGTMGRATIGHDVEIVDPDTAQPVPAGETGEIALKREGDPVVFDGYVGDPTQVEGEIWQDSWHLTGDLGVMDDDGYVAFKGRKDELILCSGYRMSPQIIEEHLNDHDVVVEAGVVGVEDSERGEIPKAFVVPEEAEPTDALRSELKDHVRDSLSKYEYPREIEFVDSLPTTTTGKLDRSALRRRAE